MINFLAALTTSIALTAIYSLIYLKNNDREFNMNSNKWLTIDAYAFKSELKRSGLSDRDIYVFREVMNDTIESIEIIEENLSLIRDFDKENNILREYFWSIIENPRQLNRAESFNYKYIPNLKRLTELHKEIEETDYVNDEIADVLKKSSYAINTVFENISSDYDSFRKYKVEELSKETELSKITKDFNSELDDILENL